MIQMKVIPRPKLHEGKKKSEITRNRLNDRSPTTADRESECPDSKNDRHGPTRRLLLRLHKTEGVIVAMSDTSGNSCLWTSSAYAVGNGTSTGGRPRGITTWGVWHIWRYYQSMCLEMLREITKSIDKSLCLTDNALRHEDVWRMDVQNHVFSTSALVEGESSASRPSHSTSRERAPSTHWIGGWVDARTGLDDVERRKPLLLRVLELRPFGYPARSRSLYRLFYHTINFHIETTNCVKLTTDLHLVPRTRNVGLYLHSPICLHGVLLN
jgi:hypothetical protein